MMEPQQSGSAGPAASRNFLDLFEEASSWALAVVDGQQRMLAANAAGRKVIEAGADGFGSLPAPVRELALESLRNGQGKPKQEVTVPGPGGPAMLMAETIFIPGDPHPMVVLLWKEAQLVQKLENALCRLDRLASIGTFSAGMAHEIKNALVAVKTFVHQASQNGDTELADIANREIRRIDTLVGQMLKFAVPAKPAYSVVPVHDLIEQALRTVRSRIESTGIKVERAFAAPSDWMRGDEFQLEQALVNLILNAVDAMPKGGTLWIGTTERPGPEAQPAPALQETAGLPRLEVRIRDSGEGIAPENVARLFEPFFTTKPSGTGLGLTMTRRIIEEHHGAINVESRLGEGTSFILMLPLWTSP